MRPEDRRADMLGSLGGDGRGAAVACGLGSALELSKLAPGERLPFVRIGHAVSLRYKSCLLMY